jgi:bifunctional enzyme CysN/CysC
MANLPTATFTDSRDRISVVLAGHVDHGKSTVIGRLLSDRGALPTGKIEELKADCRRRGMPFEWSFVTDALQAERSQGVTIDASHIWLTHPVRDTVLIDAPGHHEFIRNMITGAAAGDAALLVIDVCEGIGEQSRRHAYILHLLGLRQVAIAVNKMDLVDFDPARFAAVRSEFTQYLSRIGLDAVAFVPTVAPDGDNIVNRSARMAWYEGPTIGEVIDGFTCEPGASGRSLRLRVQDVYKFDSRRIIAGRIDSGRLTVGDDVMISPANESATVVSFETWDGTPMAVAEAGQSIGITIDRPLFVSRGDVVSHLRDMPVESNVFSARLFWIAETPLEAGRQFTLRLGTAESPATVDAVVRVVDLDSGASHSAETVQRFEFAEVIIRTPGLQAIDTFEKDPMTGRFMMRDGFEVVGGGTILLDGYIDQRPSMNADAHNVFVTSHRVTVEERARRAGSVGAVFWLTGLSGAGKSTIAMGAEQALFRLGYPVYVLDGDNLRQGLNTDLGFSPEDRAENIRRAGEVAALFADAGMVVITAFISPYRAERHRVRGMVAEGRFHEVYIDASVETCETRDPKGLYARARSGEIADFTGISAPYEAPEHPEVTLNTEALSPEDAVRELVRHIRAATEMAQKTSSPRSIGIEDTDQGASR